MFNDHKSLKSGSLESLLENYIEIINKMGQLVQSVLILLLNSTYCGMIFLEKGE